MFSTRLENFAIFIKFKSVICKTLSVWKSLKFIVWERVNSIVVACYRYMYIDSLPDNTILDLSKFKTLNFEEDKTIL